MKSVDIDVLVYRNAFVNVYTVNEITYNITKTRRRIVLAQTYPEGNVAENLSSDYKR